MRFVALALVVSAGLAEAGSPVSKVVELLKELKATVQSEQLAEQKTYNKYACWCRETTLRKINLVESQKAEYETNTRKVLMNMAKKEHAQVMITESEKQTAKNLETVEAQTEARKKAMEAYTANRGELQEALGALFKAIEVLDDPTGEKAAAAEGLIDISKAMKHTVAQASQLALTQDKAVMLRKFIEAPQQFYQTGAKYAPQSGTINGILSDMYRQFAIQLQQESSDEFTQQGDFENLMETMANQRADFAATKAHFETEKADAAQAVAEATTAREENHASIKAAQVFFKETVDGCNAKAADWKTREAARDEELDAIAQATATLEAAEDKFHAAMGEDNGVSFLQFSAKSSQIRRSAWKVLVATARSTKSIRIGSIAAMLQMGGAELSAGLFTDVVAQIRTMITQLEEEADRDKADVNECTENRARETRKLKEEQHNSEMEENARDRQNMLAEKAEAAAEEQAQNIENINAEITAADGAFTDSKRELNEDIEANKEALIALTQAINQLKVFYKCGTESKSLLQRHRQPDSLRHEDSEALGAVFSDKFNNCGKGQTILQMLQQIAADLQRNTKDAQQDISDQTAAHTKFLAASADAKNTAEDAQTAFNADKIARETQASEHNAAMGAANTEAGNAQQALDDMKANCDFVIHSYDARKAARDQEKEGLRKAMEILGSYNA